MEIDRSEPRSYYWHVEIVRWPHGQPWSDADAKTQDVMWTDSSDGRPTLDAQRLRSLSVAEFKTLRETLRQLTGAVEAVAKEAL